MGQEAIKYEKVPKEVKEDLRKVIEDKMLSKRYISMQVLKYQSGRMIHALFEKKKVKMHPEKLEKLKQFIEENKKKVKNDG